MRHVLDVSLASTKLASSLRDGGRGSSEKEEEADMLDVAIFPARRD